MWAIILIPRPLYPEGPARDPGSLGAAIEAPSLLRWTKRFSISRLTPPSSALYLGHGAARMPADGINPEEAMAMLPETSSSIDYDELIKDDRVHGRLYYDPAIFAEELEKIWYRAG